MNIEIIYLKDIGYTWEEYIEAQMGDIDSLMNDIDICITNLYGENISWTVYDEDKETKSISVMLEKREN